MKPQNTFRYEVEIDTEIVSGNNRLVDDEVVRGAQTNKSVTIYRITFFDETGSESGETRAVYSTIDGRTTFRINTPEVFESTGDIERDIHLWLKDRGALGRPSD